MRTEIVTIPSGRWRLHGILHRPADTLHCKVGVLILEESYNTKFGTHRVFLQLGEALSEAGFYALRYDNRGTCDSEGILDITFADRFADARAALSYFREHCRLDTVILWGLCMGAAVAVHVATDNRALGIGGLILCSVLADPADAALPQSGLYGYSPPEIGSFLRENVWQRNWWRILRGFIVEFADNRRKLARWVALWRRRYFCPEAELQCLRQAVQNVGPLLAAYKGPCLLIFGEQDGSFAHFRDRVNPNDQLGLGRKACPPQFEIIADGDHTFASCAQTAQLIRLTLDWVGPFRQGLRPPLANSFPGAEHGVSVAPTA